MNPLLVFIYTKNTIHHGVVTHQVNISTNTTDWEVKVKNWKQWNKKYNYVILDRVLNKENTHVKNMVLLIQQLSC